MTNTTRPPVASSSPDSLPTAAPVADRRRRLRAVLPAAVAGLVIVVMLLAVGTPLWDIFRYAAYAGWCLILPGTLVYRTLRRRPHSLIDDLALGTAVGLALELVAWAAFSLVGAQSLLIAWPLAVVIPYLSVPRLRRYWRRPEGYTSAPAWWSWTVAALVVFAVAYVVMTVMATGAAVPQTPTWYHIDTVFLLSLVAEAKLHFPMQMPTVAGEPLPYHIFVFAHEASASLVSGVDTPVVFYRLALPLIVALSTVLLAVAGWRVSGRAWVGPLAAALYFGVGEFAFGYLGGRSIGAVFAYYSYCSPSQIYGLIFTYALVAALAPVLRREGFRWRDGILLTILAVAASGAKSTVLPVVLAGLGGAGLAELIRRRRLGVDLLGVAAMILVVFVTAMVGLYRLQNQGLIIGSGVAGDALVGTALTYTIYMFARLAGIPVLARLTGRAWDRPEWFLVSAFATGWLGTVLLVHQGLSQNYFIAESFGFGAIASAMGFVALAERYAIPGRTVALALGGAGVAALGLYYALKAWPTPLTAVGKLGLPGQASVVDLAVIFALAGAVVAVVWFAAVRRRVVIGTGAVVVLAAVLLAGLPSHINAARTVQQGGARVWHVQLTPGEVQAARWLRDHSGPDDVVATNEHCAIRRQEWPSGCLSLSYWLVAYSERRELVGSWAYSPHANANAGEIAAGYVVPFWDPALLAENDAAFTDPTPEAMTRMRTVHHVRWLVASRIAGPESPALARLATLRFDNGEIAVYEL